MLFDLVLKGGHVVDPASGRDGISDIGFRDSRVATIAAEIPVESARTTLDVTGKYVVPGLIDMHAHVYSGGTYLSVDAESIAWKSGTTTFIDAGSAGAGNFEGLKRYVIQESPLHIFSLLNISYAGIYGLGKTVAVGECGNLELLNIQECFDTAAAHADIIKGVKVRAGHHSSDFNGLIPVDLALEAAEMLDLPLMTHIDLGPPGIDDVLNKLRPGDILTHCFRPFPNAAVRFRSGMIRDAVTKAREKGVYFDVGHGMGSMSFHVTRSLLEQGFWPDTISSDVSRFSVDGPSFDLLTTMSKFLCLGMEFGEVIKATTATPAKILGLNGLGTLEPGSAGDVAVLEIIDGNFEYQDANRPVREKIIGSKQLQVDNVILNGAIWGGVEPNRTQR